MTGEPADGSVEPAPGTAREGAAFGSEGGVSRLRGRVFEWVTFGATVFGILVVAALLLYVAKDAFRPFTADPRWHAVFGLTVVVPAVALAGYYSLRDSAAGTVAYTALGIPIVGLVAGGGLVVLFVELLTPAAWFGLALALLVAAGAIVAHRRLRPQAALERLAVLLAAPLLSIYGVPALSVDYTVATPFAGAELFTVSFATPALLPGVPELFAAVPARPVDWLLLVASVTLPVAVLFGRVVAARRPDGRGLPETVGATVAIASVGAVLAPLLGIGTGLWVLLTTTTLLPSAVCVEGVLRRREGAGLLFPVVLVAGVLVGLVVVRSLGFAGPDPWLDWSFLTSPTSRTPADAGIYPPLVGSVLMLVVIVVAVFPLGVGAAIYLEEYAPSDGLGGRFVELVEVNIGNLAGVPSVVYGLLGLALFVKGIGLRSGIVIVGGLTVGLLVLPIVIISAQEAIRAVPDSTREASYGMGATRWQTVRDVVLPQALPGILTGTILALGRAIGETAPLLMIGAAQSVRLPPDGFFAKFSAMPRQIFGWSSEFDADFRYGVLAAGVVTLLVVLLLMNGTAIVLRNRYQRSS